MIEASTDYPESGWRSDRELGRQYGAAVELVRRRCPLPDPPLGVFLNIAPPRTWPPPRHAACRTATIASATGCAPGRGVSCYSVVVALSARPVPACPPRARIDTW